MEYHYVDVDLSQGEDRKSLVEELEKWNPRRSFPTVVIDKDRAVIGYDENKLRQELGE